MATSQKIQLTEDNSHVHVNTQAKNGCQLHLSRMFSSWATNTRGVGAGIPKHVNGFTASVLAFNNEVVYLRNTFRDTLIIIYYFISFHY